MTKPPSSSPLPSALDGLVDLACRDGVDVRPTLLRVLTDLYVQKPVHSADEETQYVELALGLIDAVDAATRTAVAASLASYRAAPPAILAKLAGAQIQAGAKSEPKSEAPDAEPDADNLLETFFAATSDDRRLILLNLDAAASRSARLAAPASGEVIKRLENAALQRNVGEFGRTLERALGVSRALAERVARDPSGEPIVVAARALGMKAAVLQRILLFINPAVGQSVQRVFDLAQLFDELTREGAERMLAIWRQAGRAGAAPRPAHEPVYGDDEARSARSLASPAPHRTAHPGEPTPDRNKSSR